MCECCLRGLRRGFGDKRREVGCETGPFAHIERINPIEHQLTGALEVQGISVLTKKT